MVKTFHLLKIKQDMSTRNPAIRNENANRNSTDVKYVFSPKFSHNLSQKCRVCLQQGNIPLFPNANDNSKLPLSLYIKIVCDIEITSNDTYPRNLCKSCFFTLNAAMNLRKIAKKSQSMLAKVNFMRGMVTETTITLEDTSQPKDTATKIMNKSKEITSIRSAPENTKMKFIEMTKSNKITKNTQSISEVIVPTKILNVDNHLIPKEVNPIFSVTDPLKLEDTSEIEDSAKETMSKSELRTPVSADIEKPQLKLRPITCKTTINTLSKLKDLYSVRDPTTNISGSQVKSPVRVTANKNPLKVKAMCLMVSDKSLRTRTKLKNVRPIRVISNGQLNVEETSSKFSEINKIKFSKAKYSMVRLKNDKIKMPQSERSPTVEKTNYNKLLQIRNTTIKCQTQSEKPNKILQDDEILKKNKEENYFDKCNNLVLQQQLTNDNINKISLNIKQSRIKEHLHLNFEDINGNEQMDLGSDEEWIQDTLENHELQQESKIDKYESITSENRNKQIAKSFESEDKSGSENDMQTNVISDGDREWGEIKDVDLKKQHTKSIITVKKDLCVRKSIKSIESKNTDQLDDESEEEWCHDLIKTDDDVREEAHLMKLNLLKEKYLKEVLLLGDNKPRFQCQICKNILRQPNVEHVLCHFPDQTPQHVCEVCGKQFNRYIAFYQHKLIHTNILPFKCKTCPYRGRSKGLLRNHLKIHGQECRFLCSECPRRFLNGSNLSSHLRRHSEPKFKCTVCEKLFHDNFRLKEHLMSQHVGLQPASCKICGIVCKSKKHLFSHERNVHKRKIRDNNRAIYVKLKRDQVS